MMKNKLKGCESCDGCDWYKSYWGNPRATFLKYGVSCQDNTRIVQKGNLFKMPLYIRESRHLILIFFYCGKNNKKNCSCDGL